MSPRKVRDWTSIPNEDVARVSLKLLIDDDASDEPQHLIDQARAWLKENLCASHVERGDDK